MKHNHTMDLNPDQSVALISIVFIYIYTYYSVLSLIKPPVNRVNRLTFANINFKRFRINYRFPESRVARGPKFVTAARPVARIIMTAWPAARNLVIRPTKSPHIYFRPARGSISKESVKLL